MMKIATMVMLVLVFVMGPIPPATAQGTGATARVEVLAASSAMPISTSAPSSRVAQEPAGALPRATPGIEQAYWHVFAAFAATFLLLLGYVISMGRRFARLEEEVRGLRGS